MKIQQLGRFQQELLGGLTPDLPSKDSAFFVDGSNVLYSDGGVQPFPAQFRLVDKLAVAPVMGMLECVRAGARELFWGTPSALYRYIEGSGLSSVGSGYTGLVDQAGVVQPSLWSIESWGSWVLATNGKDAPQIFKTTSFGNLAGTTFTTAEIFLRYKAYMLAINTSNSGNAVEWCDYDDPETWTPAATNHARGLYLRDMDSPIKAAKVLGSNIVVYSLGMARILTWTDMPNFFGAFPGAVGIGAVGKHAVVDVAGIHYGFGPLGIWKSDGLQYQYIDVPAVHDAIYDDLNKDQVAKVVAWHDRLHGLVVFFYPGLGSTINNKAYAYNYKYKHWMPPGFARSAATNLDVFKFPIFGTSTGDILYMDIVGTDVATPGAPLALAYTAKLTMGLGEGGIGHLGLGGVVNVSG